jgi:Na+-translocating ferredoxin:NAD+ oxidoreductase RNF subunit RnfB
VIGQGSGHIPPVPKTVIYTSKDTGPFIVLIDRIKVEKNTKPFYAISAGRILRKLKMLQVEIKHVGKHRNKLIFADKNEANTVLQSNEMESYNVKASLKKKCNMHTYYSAMCTGTHIISHYFNMNS